MIKLATGITPLFMLLAIAGSAQGAALVAPTLNVLAWPRMAPDAFGCYLEKNLGQRDPRFNCALQGYQNQGDPCHNPEAYNEGPAFPEQLASRVHPLATAVDLSWEHGALQQVTVTLRGTLSETQVRQAFNLPHAASASAAKLPDNIMAAYVEAASPAQGLTSVTLLGFDHMGAGDVECSAE